MNETKEKNQRRNKLAYAPIDRTTTMRDCICGIHQLKQNESTGTDLES